MTPRDLLGIFYSYVKMGKGSDKFFDLIKERVILLIDSMSILEIQKVLNIAVIGSPKLKGEIFRTVELYIIKNLKTLPR